MKTKEEITDPVERRTYSPDEEIARKAPAVICAVASRIVRLREAIRKRDENPNDEQLHALAIFALRDAIAPLPFEAELLSGKIEQVDDAIRKSA